MSRTKKEKDHLISLCKRGIDEIFDLYTKYPDIEIAKIQYLVKKIVDLANELEKFEKSKNHQIKFDKFMKEFIQAMSDYFD